MILVRSLPGSVLLLFLLAGCGSTPASNLASDAGLIKEGVSTKNDVLTYLGDPSAQQTLSSRSERWVYYQEYRSNFRRVPWVGDSLGSEGYDRIVVSFTDDVVSDIVYSAYDSKDDDWADDFSWQNNQQ